MTFGLENRYQIEDKIEKEEGEGGTSTTVHPLDFRASKQANSLSLT